MPAGAMLLWQDGCCEDEGVMQGSTDLQPMADFATWCNNQGAAQDGLHNAVSGVFWWAWNANSGASGFAGSQRLIPMLRV